MLNKLYIIIIIIILIIIVIKVQYYFKTIEEFTTEIYVTDDRKTGKYGITCTSCPGNCTAGNYITGSCLNNTITENKSCTPCKSSCPAGKTLSGHCNGTSTSDKQCTPCPSGKYKSGDNVNECSPHISTCGSGKGLYGTNSTTSTKTCSPCPNGTYKSGDNGNECINCPVGTAVGTTGTDDICPDCESGTYQNQAGQSSCINCPTGYYCTNGSRTPHSSCTTDEVMEPGTSTSDTSCTPCKSSCPAGKTLSGHCDGKNTSDKQCTPCPNGTYKSGDNGNECSPHISTCGSGKGLYGTNSTTSTKTCNPCPSGTYKSGDNGNECINCPVGTAVGTTGTDDICPDCESGTYQNQAGQSSCINCPSGYYCTNGSRTPHSSCTTDEVMEPGTSTSDTSCTECGNRGKHYSENRCYNTGRFPFFPSSCKERWEELLDHPFKTYKWRAFRHYYDDYYDEFHDLC
jgi:hypothetical protein